MQMESVAVAFVFITNAVAIVMLGFMLFRIMGQAKATHTLLSGQTQRLYDATNRLFIALSGIDRLVERLIEMNQVADAGPKPVNLSDESLMRLQSMSDESNAAALGDIQRTLVTLRAMLTSGAGGGAIQATASHHSEGFQATQPADLGHQDEPGTPPGSHTASGGGAEAKELRRQLHEAQRLIEQLRAAPQASAAAQQTATALRDKLEQQEQLLLRAKDRAHKAEGTVNTLKQDIEQLSAQVMQAQEASTNSMTQLQTQMSTLTHERSTVQNQLDEIRDTLKRTLIEKDFIEDKLLALDTMARSTSPPAQP